MWREPRPEQGAANGVVGALEDAGYLVYAPTLPYHEPGTGWSPSQGQLQAQDYVDYIINVSLIWLVPLNCMPHAHFPTCR